MIEQQRAEFLAFKKEEFEPVEDWRNQTAGAWKAFVGPRAGAERHRHLLRPRVVVRVRCVVNIRVSITDQAAKDNALRQYAIAQDQHSTQEQILMGEGQVFAAAGEHEYALWCLKGYRAELDDRKPSRPKLALCGACLVNQCDGCRMCRVLGRET